jgi:O-6-methylguanine DNA methyltransferase
MARKEVCRIYCCKIGCEGLSIYLASSKRGAVRVGVYLGTGPDCLEYFKNIFPEHKLRKEEAINRPLIEAVKKALKGDSIRPESIRMDIDLTSFQHMVLQKVALIPYGDTRTYGEVALAAGKPRAARAVGQALKRNPLPLIYPCHRVITASGPGGFSQGIGLKRYLIEREKAVKRMNRGLFGKGGFKIGR